MSSSSSSCVRPSFSRSCQLRLKRSTASRRCVTGSIESTSSPPWCLRAPAMLARISEDSRVLYRPEDFEPLTDEPWDAKRIAAGIREIVADTDSALRGPKLLWKADDWDRWHATSPLKNLYCGAAGVLWALDELRRRGHTETTLDLPRLAMWTVERQRERPDFIKGIPLPPERESALLTGETGILLSAFRVAPERALRDE